MNFILALGLMCLICTVAGCLAVLVPTRFLVVTIFLLLIGGVFSAI